MRPHGYRQLTTVDPDHPVQRPPGPCWAGPWSLTATTIRDHAGAMTSTLHRTDAAMKTAGQELGWVPGIDAAGVGARQVGSDPQPVQAGELTTSCPGRTASRSPTTGSPAPARSSGTTSATGSRADTTEWARAGCGPAHGQTWRRTAAETWPPRIVLVSSSGLREYGLVHDLRAHRPARDHHGSTLFVPTAGRGDRAARGGST